MHSHPPSRHVFVWCVRVQVSGKAVTDTVRRLCPGLQLVGYRYEGPPDGTQVRARGGVLTAVWSMLRSGWGP
jgi:hypothetical protein